MNAPWARFAEEAPDLEKHVRGRIETYGLGFLATLRADGSPRISGIEPAVAGGHLWLGMMPNSAKAGDLKRDGRFALHNASIDKDVSEGDAKINGVAHLVDDAAMFATFIGAIEHDFDQASVDLFVADLTSVVTVQPVHNELVIRTWKPGEEVQRIART